MSEGPKQGGSKPALMPYAEIAKIVGGTKDGVRHECERALRKLRDHLVAQGIDEDYVNAHFHDRDSDARPAPDVASSEPEDTT